MQNRIAKAFIEEIHHKGIKFTMDDLAKRLGISKRTLYEHFSSKREILDMMIDRSLADFDKKTEQIVQDESLSLIEKIKGVITVLPNNNEFYDLRILEQMKRFYPEQWEKVNKALNNWDQLGHLIEQGIKEGILKNINIALAVKLITDATNATLDQQFFMKNSISVEEGLSVFVDMILFGLVIEDQKQVH